MLSDTPKSAKIHLIPEFFANVNYCRIKSLNDINIIKLIFININNQPKSILEPPYPPSKRFQPTEMTKSCPD